jgi:hypothetical protein
MPPGLIVIPNMGNPIHRTVTAKADPRRAVINIFFIIFPFQEKVPPSVTADGES